MTGDWLGALERRLKMGWNMPRADTSTLPKAPVIATTGQ